MNTRLTIQTIHCVHTTPTYGNSLFFSESLEVEVLVCCLASDGVNVLHNICKETGITGVCGKQDDCFHFMVVEEFL